ncbi:hypothetical protein MKX03_025762 [Papaver bracteatum]|nr:hypothetical protein MKX03_025762 [Papaver bracteatum]
MVVDICLHRKSEDKCSRSKKKRKVTRSSDQENAEPPQFSNQEDIEEEQGSEKKKIKLGGEGPYRNQDFISSIEGSELDNQRKLQLALEYVNSAKSSDGLENFSDCLQTVSDSRLVLSLNKWVQSLLNDEPTQWESFSVWVIFKFCLEKSLNLGVGLTLNSKILLRISCIGEHSALLSDGRCEFYSLVLDCLALLFNSSHGRVFSANMDTWSLLVGSMLDVLHKVYLVRVSNDNVGILLIRLSCSIFERFSNFLMARPKKVFRKFVDDLLEPLLSFSVMVNKQIDDSCNFTLTKELLKTVEDVLSYGLFHPDHFNEFLSLPATGRGIGFGDGKGKKSKIRNRSYCIRLFEKLENIVSEKKISSLGGVGELFRLFVVRVKREKGVPLLSEGVPVLSESNLSVGNGQAVTESTHSSVRLDMETGKSVFDIFLWFINPLKREIETYNKTNMDDGIVLLDAARCTLEATNKIIASFMHEKVYLRTEDTSDGERLNFLKELYLTLVSLSEKIHIWLPGLDNGSPVNGVSLVAKEIIVSLGYLLEIEYEVADEDLERLWKIILSFLVIDIPITGSPEICSLASYVLRFGCQLMNINSELRQVCDSIFALCKAVRSFSIANCEECVKSATMLLCFQEFRLAVCKAIKSVPEGKATDCIKQLRKDISESLEWMMTSSSKDKRCREQNLDFQAQLLGRALAEVYAMLLDNLAVTTGNSKSVGNSIQDLMIVLSPSLSILVRKEHSNVGDFLSSVTGQRYFDKEKSTRSSLMPPDSAKQVLEAMGDLLTAYAEEAEENCMECTDLRDQGYFSWVINFFSNQVYSSNNFCRQDTVESCAPLVYTMHIMAYQRLMDLRRQIKAYKFLQKEQNDMTLMGDANSHHLCEEIKILSKEAKDLTVYLMKKIEPMSAYACINSEGREQQTSTVDNAWDLYIPSLNECSLPTAVWYLLCQNTDIWGPHAAQKKFLFLLFHIPLTRAQISGKDVIKDKMDKSYNMEKITPHGISMELLHDTLFYEQTFLCRHLPSSFSEVLRQYLVSLSGDPLSGDIDFNKWLIDLSKVAVHPDPPFTQCTKDLIACRSLLNLLCWMPKVYLNSESFSDCATNVLNLERVLVFTILKNHGRLEDTQYELFIFFVCCRKALKCLLMSFHDDRGEAVHCSIVQIFIKNSNSVLWLWKSVTALIRLPPAFSEEHASELKHMSPSLMDDTSSILLTLTKKIPSAINNADFIQKLPISDGLGKRRSLSEHDPSLGAWMEHLTESFKKPAQFKKQTQSLLSNKAGLNCEDYNNMSSDVTFFHGFLWGITSILQDKKGSEEHKLLVSWLSSRAMESTDSKLKRFITFTEDYINSCLRALLVLGSQQPTCSEKDLVDDSKVRKKLPRSDFTIDILNNGRQQLNKPLLRSLLKGDNPELAHCVRQLLIGSSAILSLKMKISQRACYSSLMPILVGTLQYLLTEFANMVQEPHSISYIWLVGVVKYLEVLGSYVSSKKNSLKKFHARLIDMHLQAMGICISLCGREATLASHEINSSTKTLMGQTGSLELSGGQGWNTLRTFRARLRLSLKILVKKYSGSTAIKAVEKALGVREQRSMLYEIYAGGPDGGKVSATVAAGVYCFDSVVASVSGKDSHKNHIQGVTGALFNIVVHLQGPQIFYKKVTYSAGDVYPDPGAVILMCVEVLSKVAGKPTKVAAKSTKGAEKSTKAARKIAAFQMDSAHVIQSLRLPAALFQCFCYQRYSRTSPDTMVSVNQMFSPACESLCTVDGRFSVDLFAACCRLLSTVIRHHKGVTKMAVSILQDSVSVLLRCLETGDIELVNTKGFYTWGVQEGRLCASFLCRVYEQIKKQKEVFERYTLHIVSDYICIYSGLGPLKTGIRREIDEALRPGVYALIDACSEDDLQYLHTVLEDGPCISTLKTLVHDYKQNHQYGGTV